MTTCDHLLLVVLVVVDNVYLMQELRVFTSVLRFAKKSWYDIWVRAAPSALWGCPRFDLRRSEGQQHCLAALNCQNPPLPTDHISLISFRFAFIE